MNFFTLLTIPFIFIYDVLNYIATTAQIFITNEYPVFKEKFPESVLFLNLSRETLLMFLKGYQLVLLLEFLISYFPGINPYIAPFYLVKVLIDPALDLIKKVIPHVLGFDLSFITLSLAVDYLLRNLSTLKF